MLYDGETFQHKGRSYRFEVKPDETMGEPWKEHDGHGVVSDWTTRDKKPGELVLCTDRHSKRFYDFAASVKIAREVWGCKRGKEAADAARADFERLRGWCNDQWCWIGVVVTLLDDDGDETDKSASLWGIESDAGEYLQTVAHDLADECADWTVEMLGDPVL